MLAADGRPNVFAPATANVCGTRQVDVVAPQAVVLVAYNVFFADVMFWWLNRLKASAINCSLARSVMFTLRVMRGSTV